jgi:DMSO/TMAO reductase YedYZ heme-binding membrane subunit
VRFPSHSEPWWMLTRLSGIVLVGAVLAALSLGLLLVVRRGSGPIRTHNRLHRRLSWLALGLLVVHIGSALLDRHHVPPYAVVAPFLSPTRRIAAGTGSLATWGLVIVTLTAAGRRWLRPSWRKIHYLAYPAGVFGVAHSLLGSDARLLMFWLGLWSGVFGLAVLQRFRSPVANPARPAPDVSSARPSAPRIPVDQQASPISVVATPLHEPYDTTWSRQGADDAPGWDAVGAEIVAANRSLDEALATFRARRSLPDADTDNVRELLAGLGAASSFAAFDADGSSASRSMVPQSAWMVARDLLDARGLTVPPDVARRMAEHLLGPGSGKIERSAEFRQRRSDGDDVSVVITATELRAEMEAARSRLPRAARPFADVGTT